MKTMVKQWLVVYDEIFRTADSTKRYCALTGWNVRHRNAQLMIQPVRLINDKVLTIATIKVDGDFNDFNEFCELASKVKGLYDIDDILTSVEVVNEYNKR